MPFSGIYPMMYAFFKADGTLDQAAMRRQVRVCLQAGAHGIAVLGLGTEVNKLAQEERRLVVDWVHDEVRGAVPIAVTVSEPSVEAQVGFAQWARERGASWVILQPPPERGMPERFYEDFFAAVMSRIDAPCAIQNAPEYLGVGLGPESIERLVANCKNFVLLKGEGSALAIRRVIEAVNGRVAVFNGRGGLELLDNLYAGCAGIIPATDTFDYQVRIFEAVRDGEPAQRARAEQLYSKVLPAIVFTMQTLDSFICYGKRIAAWRIGLSEVYDRQPCLSPTDFGIECARRYTEMLGPFG
jgi:2-keto-3-deoxy-L-arabinonate dehydratase